MHYSKAPFLLCSVACCLASPTLFGATYNFTVNPLTDTAPNIANGGTFTPGGGNTGTGDLRGILNQINQTAGTNNYNITFSGSGTITLGAMLPIVNLISGNIVVINGETNAVEINGAGTYRGFLVEQGDVSLKNLSITNVKAQGGNGGLGQGGGGGGGLGAGAALFVDHGTITLSNVSMSQAAAIGGSGGNFHFLISDIPGSGPGGGGMGGNGGAADTPIVLVQPSSGGGGGGIGGVGQSGTAIGAGGGGGGGGGGINCGTNHTGSGGGSAGGGIGGSTAGQGGNGGGAGGSNAGGGGRGSNGSFGGGGGGGSGGANGSTTNGGAAGYGGGGGGCGVVGGTGGAGGFGGGGGGGRDATSGAGGFGGGGAGGGGSTAQAGGAGGFGGGGGGGANGGSGNPGGSGGVGGFGGGNGGQGFSTTCGGGGGGAGLGGAIFVNAGVVLTIQDTFSTGSGGNANSVVGGPRGFGQFDGQLGQGIGSDAFFATGSTITLDPNGSTITYNGTIGDDSPSSLGTVLNIGNVLSAPGTVTFNGANTYGGGTILNTGTLAVGSTNALGTGTLTFASLDGNILQAAASGVTLPSAIALSKHGTVDTNGFSMELSGVINGSSTLTKTGAGTLTLSASNLYSGGTHFNNGTIAVGNNNAFGPGVVTFDVNDNNTLQAAVDGLSISNLITLSKNGVVDTNNFSLTLAGDITGPGSLNKIGAGQLRLSGAHDFIGGTTVSAGMLTIDGSLSSNIDVLPGSILNGSGLVTGDLTIGGTLGPGNMIGTFEVIGNVTFQTGSAFQVEADPSRADILDVDASGNITIQPGSTITIFPTIATYGANTTYLIATAGESGGIVIGTFDNVTNSFPLIEAQILYTKSSSPSPSLKTLLAGPNQILMILNFVPFSSVVTSGNAGALANSLNGFTPVPGSDMSFVMQQLYFLPTAQALEDALNQMQPSILNSFSMAQQNSSLFVVSALNKHTTDTRQTRSPCTDAGDRKWQVWGDGSVDWARQREDRQNVGFHAKTNLGAGGVDYRVSKQFYLGVLGAYTHTSVDCHHRLSKGRINTYYTGLYSSWISPFSFIDLSVIGNFSDYHSKRVVQFGEIDRRPQGHHRGTGVTAHLDTGISLPKERKAQCYPYGQFDYVYQHEKGYTETKAQSLNNNIRSRNLSMLRSELGVQGKYCYAVGDGVLVPSAKLGWVREARIHGKKINARLVEVPNRYTVEGLYPQRSMVAVGASLMGIFFNQTAHLSLAYEGLFGSGYASNAGNIALNLQF